MTTKERKYVTLEKRPDGIALLWLDNPRDKINKLEFALGEDLRDAVEAVLADAEIKAAVVISRKTDNWIVGADIMQLYGFPNEDETLAYIERGQRLFDTIAAAPKPFVAAIHGPAMGGGLETALACHYRIVTDHPKTALALPEVKLGFIPAAGGTQRLPRLIGLQAALDMALTGKTVFARRAKKIGLADDVVVPYALTEQAVAAALRLVEQGHRRRPRKRKPAEAVMEDLAPARKLVFKKAAEMIVKQSRGNYPAPPRILECIRIGLEQGEQAGLRHELKCFREVLHTEANTQLVKLFFAVTEKKKLPEAKGAPAVRNLGVIGAGLMGAGIALATATGTEATTYLKDVDDRTVAKGLAHIHRELTRRREKKIIDRFAFDRLSTRVIGRADYAGFERVDLVIEAVYEDLDLKRRILAETEAVTRADCVFASNTSALPIAEIAKGGKRPENVIGMHYFSPVPKMPLLEIITTSRTSKHALQTAAGFGLAQGKTVIIVKDGPGFYTTRILVPYLNEAGLLLQEGAGIEQIDRAMVDWGFPVGPLTLFDEIGIDVAAHVSGDLRPLFAARGGKFSEAPHKLLDAGYKGRKNKQGFYCYEAAKSARAPWGKKKKKEADERVYAVFGAERRTIDPETMRQRLALAMINEAVWCLQEEILRSPVDGDLGAILGMGFPPFRGGPFRYLDTLGAAKAVELMEDCAARFGGQFTPAPLLLDYAKQNRKFYRE